MLPLPHPAEASLFSDLGRPEMRLFGPMQATWGDGRSFLPRTTKTRALLAVLALAGAKPVPRGLLMNLLWTKREREQAQASLRQSVHELRQYLAPMKDACILSERDNLTLQVYDLWLDARFAQTPDFHASHVADVFRGRLLRDLAGVSEELDAWILGEQKNLSETLSLKVAAFLSETTSHDATIKMAEAIISYDSSHQAAWTALVESYIAIGDASAALDVCHRCRIETRGPENFPTLDLKTVFANVVSKASLAEPAPRYPVHHDPPHATTNPWNKRTVPIHWHAARLAISPTRAVGSTSADFAMCIDWQIISALCKFEDLSCTPLSPNRRSDGALQHLAAEGFNFLLESCIDRQAEQYQIILRLRDLRLNGEVFWSQRICRAVPANGLFGADFATLLAPQVAAEISKHQAIALESCSELKIDVCGLVLRASRAVQRLERQNLSAIDKLLTDAIRQDDRHPALLVWLAYVKLMELGQGWLSEPDSSRRVIGNLVDQTLALNPESATVLSIAGHVLAFTQNRLGEGLTLQEKALSKNPNLPSAWLFSGLAHTYAGEHSEAITRFQRAKLLSPADQHAYFIEMGLSLAHLLVGDTVGALDASSNAIRLNPNFSSSFKVGVSASGYNDLDRADRSLLQRLLRLEPALTVERVLAKTPLTRRADQAHLSDGLRLAGLPK